MLFAAHRVWAKVWSREAVALDLVGEVGVRHAKGDGIDLEQDARGILKLDDSMTFRI
ncbi:hypothetical protein [Agromyces tropicus]|uniref:hypothetical protein n=1 Tax=Agromyces tropicus TaxID=555371 RepID=UPI0031D8E2FD